MRHRRLHGRARAAGARARRARPGINQGQLFYNLNALVLGALARGHRRRCSSRCAADDPGTRRCSRSHRRCSSRPPSTGTCSPIGLAAFGWYLLGADAGRLRPASCSASAPSAKFWPLLLVGAAAGAGLRARRMREFGRGRRAGGVSRWLVVNLPVADRCGRRAGTRFFELNSDRPIDWGTLWYIGAHFPLGNDRYGLPPFQWLERTTSRAERRRPGCCSRCRCLGDRGARRCARRAGPRLAQLAFLVVALFLIFSKVWSQQFVLWLIPLVVLARPRWGAFLAWQVAEVATSSLLRRADGRVGQAGLPGGGLRARVRAAADHAWSCWSGWWSARSCAPSWTWCGDLRRRPGRRRARRRTGPGRPRPGRPAARAVAGPADRYRVGASRSRAECRRPRLGASTRRGRLALRPVPSAPRFAHHDDRAHAAVAQHQHG